MDEIAKLRARIDEIDREILIRLKARSENAGYIGQIKQARRLPIRAPEREKQILRRISDEASSLGLNPNYARNVFQHVVKLAIEAQLQPRRNRSRLRLAGLRCLVVGGTGEMGRLFVYMMKSQGASVSIAGREERSTLRTTRQLRVEPARLEDAAESDVVVVSVPVTSTLTVATKTASLMTPGSMLADISSVKEGIADKIAKSIPTDVEYVSLHPLFGPQALTLHTQTVLFLPYRTGPTWHRFKTALEALGLTLTETTAKRHDRVMAYVQVIHHYALLSLSSSLMPWDGSYKTTSLGATLDRVNALAQSANTIRAIQEMNPYSALARRQFLKSAQRLLNGKNLQLALDKLPGQVQKWSRKR